ncbi:cupin domain-containing protein [Thiofaba sp. EF100]|uniref:cupin domain-containing protein n=1 Tax=Thiofaba sp. EF100 TaxID=3121274 RepID=UPI003221C6A2
MWTTDQVLGGMPVETFLRDYWQKKPLLIRQAFPGFLAPVTPEELAGLACEEGIHSRMVLEEGGSKPWELRYGPFSEEDFARLPERGWSILVSDVEKAVPELMAIIEPFRFIPDWRIDDLMMSYAPPGGSVGAHVDQYDVFLLQAWGRRRWMIESTPRDDENAYIDGLDLRILREFNPDQSWDLEPGDMLYLPPGIPHHGVALSECMTWSIGFRAPAHADIVGAVAEALVDRIPPKLRYSDPDLAPQGNPGEISAAALTKLTRLVREALTPDDAALQRILGEWLTERNLNLGGLFPDNEPLNLDELREMLEDGAVLRRVPAARLAFITQPGKVLFFMDGECVELSESGRGMVEMLCREQHVDAEAAAKYGAAIWPLLHRLYARGCLMFTDDE